MTGGEGKKFSFALSSTDSSRKKRRVEGSADAEKDNPSALKEIGRDGLMVTDEGNTIGKVEPLSIPLPEDDEKRRVRIEAEKAKEKSKEARKRSMMARIARGEVDVEAEAHKEEDEQRGKEAEKILEQQDHMDVTDVPVLIRRAIAMKEKNMQKAGTNDPMVVDENFDKDTEQYRQDVEDRPESSSLEDYERVPISAFGEAMLRGMGWKPGGMVGLNARGLAAPVEFRPRHHRLGLGASPAALAEYKKQKGLKERAEDKDKGLVAVDSSGRQLHHRTLNEELVAYVSPDCPFREGNIVEVVHGKHEGMLAVVKRIRTQADEDFDFNANENLPKPPTGPRIEVQFVSMEKAVLKPTDAKVIDPVTLNPKSAIFNLLNEKEKRKIEDKRRSNRMDSNGTSNADNNKNSNNNKNAPAHTAKKNTGSNPILTSWIRPNISVRIVSKSFLNGAVYCKRGVVEDVVSPTECIVRLEDSGKVIEGVHSKFLESALPRPGGKVIVLKGPSKGMTGTLMERDSKKNRVVVQNAGDLSIHSFTFEDVAQYHGQMEET